MSVGLIVLNKMLVGKCDPRAPSVPGKARWLWWSCLQQEADPDGSALLSAGTLRENCSTLLLLVTSPFPAVSSMDLAAGFYRALCAGTGQAMCRASREFACDS